jgi:hypothetical protein
MSTDAPKIESLEETRRKYLRWSIPSIVLAIVTLLFTVASFWAQRHVQWRYESIVSNYLNSNLESDPPWTLDSMRHAGIAAKRLVVENPESAEAATAFAMVELHSQRELLRSISKPEASIDRKSLQAWTDLARTIRQRAIDSMRRAATLEGPAATQARLWMLDWQFREDQIGNAESEAQLLKWQEACEEMIAFGDDAKQLLADLRIHRALLAASNADSESVNRLLEEAVADLDSITEHTIERDASWIEATAFANPLKAKSEAVKAISNYRHFNQASAATWREREAMFRIRLGLGNPKEAFDFAWTSLSEIPSPERDLFRWSTASSAIRTMKSQLLNAGPEFDRNPAPLIGFAVRIAPDSGRITSLLETLVLKERGPATDAVAKALEHGQDLPLKELLGWLAQCSSGLDTMPTPPATLAEDPLLAPGTMRAILLLQRNDALKDQEMLKMLGLLVPVWNDNFELHSLRSDLAIQLEDYPSALESLVKLRERFPEEPRIHSLLKNVESKLNRSDSDSPTAKPNTP